MLTMLGLSLVIPGLALPIVAVAVMLYVIPSLLSRVRGGARKEAMRMNGNSLTGKLLSASAYVGSAFLTNAAAAAVPG
jgi:hypothetical protein